MSSFIEKFGAQVKQLANMSNVRSVGQFPGYGYAASYGSPFSFFRNGENLEENTVLDSSHTNSIVDISLSYIARQFGLAEWQVQQILQKEFHGVDTHPLINLMRVPNEHYDGDTLLAMTAQSLALGNAYWILCRDQGGVIREIWWAPQLWDQNALFGCTPYAEPGINDNLPFCYLYRANGKSDYLPIEDVIHFRLPIGEHFNPFVGKNPLRAQFRHIGADDKIADYTYYIAANFGAIGALLINKTDKEVTAEAAKELKIRWKENTTGRNRGMPLISPHDFDVHFPDNSPEKMAIDKLNDTPEERIPAALGLNAMAVQLGAGLARSTFSNSEQASKAAFDGGIAPLHKIVATAITNKLIPQLQARSTAPTRFYFDYSNIPALQEDENAKRTSINELWKSGAITLAQFNAEMGYDAPPKGQENLRFFDLQSAANSAAMSQFPALKGAHPFLAPGAEMKRASPDSARWLQSARDLLAEAGTNADREKVVRVAQARMTKVSGDLRNADTTVAKWAETMQAEIVNAHTAQAALGYRLPVDGEMPDGLSKWLEEKLTFHLDKFDGFHADVVKGRYDATGEDGAADGYTDGLTARSSQYANATRSTYENAGLLRGKDDGHEQGCRVMGAVAHCATCQVEADKGWGPIDEVAEIGDSECGGNCACVILTRAGGEG